MAKYWILPFILLFSLPVFAQEKIEWLTWEQALEKQKTERKKVFIDLYTDWCGWCKKMDASTFQDAEIIKHINKYYYPVKFNAEQKDTVTFNGHDFVFIPNGKRGTHTFAMSLLDNQMSYPSFVILDENYTRLHIIKGYQKPDSLEGLLLFFASNQFLNYKKYLDHERTLQKK